MTIHPSATVDKKAKLASDVKVGPYAVIGPEVKIDKTTEIGPHVVIDGHTSIGKNCRIFPSAFVGTIPQDLKYKKGTRSFLKIGDDNIIRECVTMNPSTDDGGTTSIGSGNLFMAYSHVAHDCEIGDNCIIANSGTLAGHVTLEDRVVIGGLTAIHQFVRVGKLAMIGGCSKVVQDIPPFSTCDGHPARVYSLNLVGLKRAGISKETCDSLRKVFKILFHSELSVSNAVEQARAESGNIEEILYLIDFVRNSKRGVCRGGKQIRTNSGKR